MHKTKKEMEEMKMKKRTKRAVSMVLAAGTIASLVVGASADEGFHESGLPITDEPVTLTDDPLGKHGRQFYCQ